jgi:tetratricopeptide (TPR) repeat protein
MRFLVGLGLVAALAGPAHAACPDKRASCILHEEGVALFLEKQYEEAAKKFAAAIAAEPTARSYLGYAQAVENLGQIALAYDTMVAANKLSDVEVQRAPNDPEITSRKERIKYKLGELRAKIGFVWLRVPDGVSPRRIVGVKREGEGDLAQPLTQWTAVAPNRQILIASIDDGTRIEVVAEVAAGSQGVVVIPVPAGRGGGMGVPPPNVGGPGRPLAALYMPAIRPPQPTYSTYFAVGLSVLAPGPVDDNISGSPRAGSGSGFTLLYERKIAQSIGLTSRLEYLFHGESDDLFGMDATIKGSEVVLLAGARTMGSRTLHGRAGVGLAIYSQQAESATGLPLGQGTFTRAYPALELGGGLHLGRARFQMGLMFSPAPSDGAPNLGTRFMGTFAIDLYRKEDPRPAPPPAPGQPGAPNPNTAPPIPR